MNCYLSWNLKDMTNISAEKLQKNISQQASYIQLYRSELTKEAYKFNIGSLLRHICIERSSFGTEPIQKRATDCLIVFLHAAAFQKVTYFAPTDAENPAVAKCARNLHRLMLENVKSTMRFIDYEVLQKHARGEIDTDELFSERQRIHEAVFPNDNLITISKNDGLNDEFLKLIDMETQKAKVFVDFDVQRNTSVPTELCQKLASVPRSEAALPESRYGLIGSCKSSLATPFIKYGNSYYSFVTAYSLNAIAPVVDQFADTIPVSEPEPTPEPEPVAEPEPIEEPVQTPEPISEPIIESVPEPVSEPEPEPEAEPVEEEPAETIEPEDIDPEESAEAEEPEEAPEETEPVETEEEDDIPFDEPEETYYEPEMTEASEEEEDDDEPETVQTEVEEPVLEQSPSEEDDEKEESPEDDPFEDDDDDLIEEAPAEYSALVSPDTYDYLNQAGASEFKEDPMLEEQDHGAWYDDEDEDEELPPEDDEPDPYDGESLFSIMDDSEEDEEPPKEEPAEEPEPANESPFIAEDEEEASPAEPEPIVRFVEPTEPEPQHEAEEPVAEEEPQDEVAESEPEAEEIVEREPEVEPEAEPEPEPEPESEPEPQAKPAEDQTLPLLDQILRCAPSKNNPIVQYLANCPFEQKKEIVRFIELARKAWLIDGKDKMFSIPDTTISVAVFSETQDPMLNIQRRENIGAVMFASQKDSWNSLEISYDGSGQFVKADYVRISRNSYTDWEWKIVEKLGTRLMERRAK